MLDDNDDKLSLTAENWESFRSHIKSCCLSRTTSITSPSATSSKSVTPTSTTSATLLVREVDFDVKTFRTWFSTLKKSALVNDQNEIQQWVDICKKFNSTRKKCRKFLMMTADHNYEHIQQYANIFLIVMDNVPQQRFLLPLLPQSHVL